MWFELFKKVSSPPGCSGSVQPVLQRFCSKGANNPNRKVVYMTIIYVTIAEAVAMDLLDKEVGPFDHPDVVITATATYVVVG